MKPTDPAPVNFRQSSLKDLMTCPLKWKYGQVDGLERVQTSALYAGTAFHNAIETALVWGGSMDGDVALDCFKAGWHRAGERAEREGGVRWDEDKEKTALVTFVAFEDWFTHMYPVLLQTDRLGVEVKFGRDPLDPEDDGEPLEVLPGITISGTIDFVYRDVEGRLHVIDWKTASRAWRTDEVPHDVQASMYSLACKHLYGEIPATFTFEVWIKGNTPRHETYATSRSEEDIARFLWLLEQYAGQVRTGTFPPNTNGWWHTPRWCPFWDLCPAGAGPVRPHWSDAIPTSSAKGESGGSTPLEDEAFTRKTGGGVTTLSTSGISKGGRGAVTPPAASQATSTPGPGLPSSSASPPRPGPGASSRKRKASVRVPGQEAIDQYEREVAEDIDREVDRARLSRKPRRKAKTSVGGEGVNK